MWCDVQSVWVWERIFSLRIVRKSTSIWLQHPGISLIGNSLSFLRRLLCAWPIDVSSTYCYYMNLCIVCSICKCKAERIIHTYSNVKIHELTMFLLKGGRKGVAYSSHFPCMYSASFNWVSVIPSHRIIIIITIIIYTLLDIEKSNSHICIWHRTLLNNDELEYYWKYCL